ncbi:P-loop NTPase fold protein [Flavobacteriaceae bacterium S356]|uniref:P-loop NTPase fold protein n=1 Tax=Asprobacillus argus TaxID=3076534 RepID=A0ABU3LDK5_9FLAO|nr:P-loop NTPase fold protein [Flavobacteriaceae bacterium S356]
MELKKKFKKCLQKMRKPETVYKDDFHFISEKPKGGDLLFGHKEIVLALEKIVLKSPESFTIGLYGDWGSGKSSIAETLQSNLKKRNIPLVIFDVWKHEGDALRRTFLKDLDKKLSGKSFGKEFYKEGFELEKNLESDINIETKDGYDFKGKKLVKNFLVIALFAVVPLILVFTGLLGIGKVLSIQEFSFDNLTEKILQIIGGLTIPVVFWLKFSNSFILEKKTTVKKSRIQDPLEFENSFHNILENLTSNVNKIVVVFDNLDRVNGKKAVEIISTIKTFLEPIDKKNVRNIVFIIPCDSIAIKKHLASTFSVNDTQYADEFLRKFFNTIIWIPEFYINELEKLAIEKLEESGIIDFKNDELSALIVLVFDKNPRQIIQFINILISNYILIKERRIEGFSLQDDIAKLAKYLLLIQKFPEIMNVYKNTMSYDLDALPDDLNEEKNGVRKFSGKVVSEFYRFLRLTEHVKIDSLDLFFKLRRSDFENKFENGSRLIKLIETNRIKELVGKEKPIINTESDKQFNNDLEFINDFQLKDKEYEFGEILIEKMRTMTNPILLAKFIDGLLHLLEFKEIDLEAKIYRMICDKLKQSGSNISDITPKLLITQCYNKLTNNIYKKGLRESVNERHVDDFVGHHKNI